MEIVEHELYIYSGILFHYQEFAPGNDEKIQYILDCPEYAELREKYDLENIAGKGGDFQRAKRLLHYLAPRLTHSPWYDNHVPCNALALLDYSLNNKEQGINCVNKSKILEECCLALGIYARRVFIMPYSPYDFDNHVVTEIYDRKLKKWIMLDPTTDGYFVNQKKEPLSVLEIRDCFANDRFVTYVCSTDSLKVLEKLRTKYMDANAYICKNLFYVIVDQKCCFGESEESLCFCPGNYSLKNKNIANMQFRIRHLPEEYKEYLPKYEERLQRIRNSQERQLTSVEMMLLPPDV